MASYISFMYLCFKNKIINFEQTNGAFESFFEPVKPYSSVNIL